MKSTYIAAIALALMFAPGPSARAADLGSDALSFVLLSMGSKIIMNKSSQAGLGGNGSDQGAIGGASAILKKGSQSVNDVVTNPGGIILKKGAEAFGCITGGGSVKLANGATCVHIVDTSGLSPELAVLADAIGGAAQFAGVVAAQIPAQTLPAVVVPADGSATITNTQPGLNIISVPSVTLKKNATLTFSGQPGDTVILAIDGNLKWGADTSMSSNGVDDVLFVVSGHLVSVGKDSQLRGTILAPHAKCTVGADAQVIGAVICGKKIALAHSSQVIYVPTTVTIP